MKSFVVLILVSLTAAAPQGSNQQDARIQPEVLLLKLDNDNNGLGNYKFEYELSDGTKREEHGELKNEGTPEENFTVEGSYEWQAPDGTIWVVTFVADDKGFHPRVESRAGGGISSGVVASLLG